MTIGLPEIFWNCKCPSKSETWVDEYFLISASNIMLEFEFWIAIPLLLAWSCWHPQDQVAEVGPKNLDMIELVTRDL
jgi:hypothetical protein